MGMKCLISSPNILSKFIYMNIFCAVYAKLFYTRSRFGVLTIILSLCILEVTAQPLRFDKLSISDGLSSNSVYSIFQDSEGVLWFGTLDGLNRYDGYSVTVYKHNNLKNNSISNNRVTMIYEDQQHQLWLYDEFSSTLINYVSTKDEFSTYHLDKTIGSELGPLDTVYEDKNNVLQIRSRGGYRLRYNRANNIFEFSKGDSTKTGWHKKKEWEKLLTAFNQHLLSSRSAFNSSTITISRIFRDSNNRYWIGTRYDGLYTAVEQNGEFHFFSHLHTTEKFKTVSSEDIFDIYEDQSNVVWIGTKNNGLYRYSPHKYKFRYIEEVQLNTGAFQLGTIRAIAQDANKNIWIGTNERGLLKIDVGKGASKLFTNNATDPHSIGHNFIRSLWVDPEQNLWVGHYKGFSRYRESSGDFTQYYPKGVSNKDARIYDFKKGKDKSVWMAGWDLILNFNPNTNQSKIISRSDSTELDFSSENIRDLELDDQQQLWIAVGEKGMALFDKTKKSFNMFRYEPENANGLPSDNIFDVFEDSYKNIWLATADGLCLFNLPEMTFQTYTVNDGLPSNFVYGMMEDSNRRLWLSTTKGIARFDLSTKTFKNYDSGDGLPSNEFSENAFYQNPEGAMFFGGINGVTIFHPDSVPDNTTPPKVAITSMRFASESTEEPNIKHGILKNEEFTLAPEQRSISFEFIAFHYVNPLKMKYAYMLEGFDNTWTYRDANVRFANYTNLEPGTYYFKVKAANSDGVWSKEYAKVKFTITEPFYYTWWFISTTMLAIVVSSILFYRKRIAFVRKQQSMKAIQLESELNFLKSQVNPHFLFNTLNNIYALCQVNSKNAAPMVGKISEMMRYMIYDCNSDFVPIQKEIEYMQNYIDLNQLKSNRRLNAFLHIQGNPEGLKIAPLLLINFLENSFKHGDINLNGYGYIRAELIIKEKALSLKIQNSFREKSISDNNHGIGLENVKHRLTLLYPNRHSLRITKNNRIFEIELNLQLN
jgi:ligand-binding sensor domain-containing protein